MKDKQWTLTTGPICCVCPCLPTKKTNKDWFRNLWWGAYQERFKIITYTYYHITGTIKSNDRLDPLKPPVMNCLMTLFTALMIVEGIWTAGEN